MEAAPSWVGKTAPSRTLQPLLPAGWSGPRQGPATYAPRPRPGPAGRPRDGSSPATRDPDARPRKALLPTPGHQSAGLAAPARCPAAEPKAAAPHPAESPRTEGHRDPGGSGPDLAESPRDPAGCQKQQLNPGLRREAEVPALPHRPAPPGRQQGRRSRTGRLGRAPSPHGAGAGGEEARPGARRGRGTPRAEPCVPAAPRSPPAALPAPRRGTRRLGEPPAAPTARGGAGARPRPPPLLLSTPGGLRHHREQGRVPTARRRSFPPHANEKSGRGADILD